MACQATPTPDLNVTQRYFCCRAVAHVLTSSRCTTRFTSCGCHAPPRGVCTLRFVTGSETSINTGTNLMSGRSLQVGILAPRGSNFASAGLSFQSGVPRRSIPCSSGSSPYRSLAWPWLLAHSLKPLQPLQPLQPLRRPPRRRSTRTGSQVIGLTDHVRRVSHSTGGVLALAAPRGAGGTFKPAATMRRRAHFSVGQAVTSPAVSGI